jgi:hypothetical protein
MSATQHERQWVRVTKAQPCEICGKPDWCGTSSDGQVARCMRESSPHESSGGGWIHRLNGEPRAKSAPKPPPQPTRDWAAMAARFAENATTEQVAELAARLHVEAQALRELGVGRDGNLWTHPMFCADGAVCGVKTKRSDWTSPGCITGSKLGVFRRAIPDDGLLLVCEGESDTASALSLGFDAIGVPGAGHAGEAAAAFARGRETVIVADNDEAGTEGAKRLRAALLPAASSLRIVRPPQGIKDLRQWLIDGLTREALAAAIEAAPVEVPIGPESSPMAVRFLRPWELAEMPQRELLWGAGLGRGELGMLFGPWGSFKSFVGLALAVAIADGADFLGFKTKPGAVGLIVGEGAAGQVDRLRAATSVARIADRDDAIHDRIGIACGVPALTTAAGFDATVAAIEAMPVLPSLVIIDTVARALSAAGLDENSTSEMGLFVAALDRLRARFPGLAILAVHHSGNDRTDRCRGSIALPSGCDFVAHTEPRRGHGLPSVRLIIDKVKDGENPAPLRLDFAKVVVRDDADGKPVSSLRIDSYAPDVPERDPSPKARTEDLLRDAMRAAGAAGIDSAGARSATSKVASTVSEALGRMVESDEVEPFTDETGRKRWRFRGAQ